MTDSLRPHGLQHTGFPSPLLSPEFTQILVHWVHDAIIYDRLILCGCLLLLLSMFPSIRDLLLSFHRSLRLCLFFFQFIFFLLWRLDHFQLSVFIHSFPVISKLLLSSSFGFLFPLGFYCIFQPYHFQLVVSLIIYIPLLRFSFSSVSRVF